MSVDVDVDASELGPHLIILNIITRAVASTSVSALYIMRNHFAKCKVSSKFIKYAISVEIGTN